MSQAQVIIINEFLAFCQNKIDIMDELSIVQKCNSNFTDEEVECGKASLFDALSGEGIRLIQRKGEDKRKKNIRDVLKVFHEIKPELQPTYVAKDLNRLPPVSFDHVDVTRLLKDILILKTELQKLREDSISKSEFHTLKSELCASIESSSTQIEPVSPGHKGENAGQGTKRLNSKKERAVPSPVPAQRRKRSDSLDTIVSPPSYRAIATRPVKQSATIDPTHIRDTSDKHHDDGFTPYVNRKKRQLRNINKCGTATDSSNLKVAQLPESIYLSRLETTCTIEHVKEYIESKGVRAIDVQLLPQRKELVFRSFKITVPKQNLDTFLSTDFWPADLVFRRFRERFSHANKTN